MTASPPPIATVLWQRLDLPGHEICTLRARGSGWELAGTAVFAHAREPCRLDYRVLCDGDWRTTAARVRGQVGPREIALEIVADERRRWRFDGEEVAAVEGCLDVDLGFSPSTNLLPIRRTALEVGEVAEVKAAWLSFPALELRPLEQTYRRVNETTFRYASAGGSFQATLEVDAAGFVTSYPGLWKSVL